MNTDQVSITNSNYNAKEEDNIAFDKEIRQANKMRNNLATADQGGKRSNKAKKGMLQLKTHVNLYELSNSQQNYYK